MTDVDKLADSIHELSAISTRIDERVNTLIGRQEELRDYIHQLQGTQQTLLNRVVAIEIGSANKTEEIQSRVRELELTVAVIEKETKGNSKSFDKIFDIGFKVIATIVGALLLFKLGIK